jgi:hypothetical protein
MRQSLPLAPLKADIFSAGRMSQGAQQRTLVGADKFAPHAHTPDNTIVSSGSQSELGLAL